MKTRTMFLWLTPALLGAFLIGLVAARAVENQGRETWWSEEIEARVRGLVGSEYVDDLPIEEQQRLFYAAMEAYLLGLDDFSTFYDPEECREMEVETTGQFGGVGVLIRPDPEGAGLVVTGIRRGDPAEKAGVAIGDLIVGVDDRPIAGLSIEEITTLIKGVPGTRVTLSVLRDGATLDVPMFRSEVKVDSVKGVRIVDPEHGVGYLHVTSFQENTGIDARTALEWLLDHGARSIILDLRQNRGGVLERGAVALVDLFLDEGVIVKTSGRAPGSHRVYEANRADTVCRDQPLVVLVDGGSASAAEVAAGAFQDHRRGILVGQRTFGKFLVQSIHRLPDHGTAVQLTTARYYTPYGRWLQRRDREGIRGGLLPDVVVDRPREEEEALIRVFVSEHGLDMQVGEVEAEIASSDRQLARAIEILADYDALAEKAPK